MISSAYNKFQLGLATAPFFQYSHPISLKIDLIDPWYIVERYSKQKQTLLNPKKCSRESVANLSSAYNRFQLRLATGPFFPYSHLISLKIDQFDPLNIVGHYSKQKRTFLNPEIEGLRDRR